MNICSQCKREAIIVCACSNHNLCRYHMNKMKIPDEEILERIRVIESKS